MLVKGDLLKFVDGNVLVDIDVPTVLVVMLPLDLLPNEKAIISCLLNRLENLYQVVPGFPSQTRHPRS